MTPTSSVSRVRCANPSPMTLEGTNTYVIGGREDDVVLIDPGPADHPEHLEAVLEVVAGRRVSQILVTHHHRDHTGAVEAFMERTGAPVRGHAESQCRAGDVGGPPAQLRHGEQLHAGSTSIRVVHTPGHTSDSVCFFLPDEGADGAMLTGDTLLGRGTTMLDHPDGTLTDYLASLRHLTEFGDAEMLPAHGPARDSMAETARTYITHREQRLDQVRELVAAHGSLEAEHLGQLIYEHQTSLPERITTKIAAAQLDHLRHLGDL